MNATLSKLVSHVILSLMISLAAPFLAVSQVQVQALPAQPLGPDDLVSLTVSNSPELTHQFRISPDGLLRLPLLSNPIPARDRYPQEVQEDIREALRSQKLLVNPSVSLSVMEYASRPVTVMGAVRRPITFQATAKTTLLEALARAEGIGPEAGDSILVTRPGVPGTDPEVISVPVRALLEDREPVRNLRLFGGEQVRVPEAPRVYVLGNVKRNGMVLIKDPREATVLKVLSQAEGLAPYSSWEAVVYRRGNGERKEIVVSLKRILKGKLADVQLQPFDILYVPESRGKRLTADVLDRVAGFGMSTASGFLVFRQ